jgi:LysR family transcriptional regulator, glycine cleavage system transcriptional activator
MAFDIGSRQNWESLRVFAACAERGSFTAAAEELGLTQAAVSQRIAQLEGRLGVPLFVRRPKLRLTEAGARLAPRVAQGFTSIERALRELRSPRLLSLTTTVTFATLWLLPRLPQYRRHDPAVSLALDIADEYRPLDDGRFDIAIRHCPEPGPGTHAQRLFPLELTPYVSSKLLKKGERLTVERLARMPLIPEEAWDDWFRAAGVKPQAPGRRGQLLVRNQHLILEAVLAGEGAGLLTPRFAMAHVASGRLLRPFRQSITAGSYFLAWHEDRDDDPLVAGFREWIGTALAAEAAACASHRAQGR